VRMLCLTKYGSRGPSSRYRVYQFLPFLEAAGIRTDVQTLHDDTYLDVRFRGGKPGAGYLAGRLARRAVALGNARRYELVFIQKEIFPYLPGLAEAILAAAGGRLVVDLDDAVFLYYQAARSSWVRFFLAKKFPRLLRRSRLVLAGNRYLQAYAEKYAPRVVHFPTVVDTDRFKPGPAPGSGGHSPVIGWIGSPETAGYLETVVPALEQLAGRRRFCLSLVGADAVKLAGVPVKAKPWRLAEEADDLRTFDIGIMPLADAEWSQGKCALKLLQYMSTGLASVSTPTGASGDITDGGRCGFLAGGTAEWVDRLELLLDDPTLRGRLGRDGRERVEGHYSLKRQAPLLVEHLIGAAEGRSG
jgi:glycosyltransferase involved in cell wall biosynthesis